jgi:SAM-dependent methyltransferase
VIADTDRGGEGGIPPSLGRARVAHGEEAITRTGPFTVDCAQSLVGLAVVKRMDLIALAPLRLTARVLRRLANILDRLGRAQIAVVQHPHRPAETDAAEAYYGKHYLHWLEPLIAQLPTNVRVIDLGCGAGRLLLAVATLRPDLKVTGVDISPGDAALARRNAVERGCDVEIIEDECIHYLRGLATASADLILFTEVSFFMPNYRDALGEIARVPRPEGILFASFRSRWFNTLSSVARGHFASAVVCLTKYGGLLWNTPYEFHWHTCESIRSELTGLGLTVEALYGVGVFSGRPGDPLAHIGSPSADLLEVELVAAKEFA